MINTAMEHTLTRSLTMTASEANPANAVTLMGICPSDVALIQKYTALASSFGTCNSCCFIIEFIRNISN